MTRMLLQSLFFVTLTTAGLVYSSLTFSSKLDAQTPPPPAVNTGEVLNYAKAVLSMEPARQQAFDDIKKMIGSGDVPKIVCNEPSSFNSLPGKAKDIAVNYCKRSKQIVESNGLTIEQFNKITQEMQNNDALKQQIYNELIRLQKKP